MLNIYAKSFMTAARTDCIAVRDVKNSTQSRVRWLPSGHWFLAPKRCIDLNKL
ncbi:MAG: hypothetical protein ACI9PY_000174 [Ascidiaceihabitans sp.]|jgi:hypothetical protein